MIAVSAKPRSYQIPVVIPALAGAHDSNPKILIKKIVKTILKISLKAKSINENKYNNIIEFLDAYVNNNQKDLDKFKERNGPSNIYDDKQLKLLVNYENNVKNAD